MPFLLQSFINTRAGVCVHHFPMHLPAVLRPSHAFCYYTSTSPDAAAALPQQVAARSSAM